VRREAIQRLKAQVDRVDYFEIVDGESLESVTKVQKNLAALTACFVGKTRLIDNVSITQ
jgi:pantothenate synthetase